MVVLPCGYKSCYIKLLRNYKKIIKKLLTNYFFRGIIEWNCFKIFGKQIERRFAMAKRNTHFLNRLFYSTVTEDIRKEADNYSVETEFECPNNEYTPCNIYCTLSLGTEKTWVFVKCHSEKIETIGHLEYWNTDEQTIEIASKAVCEITKKINTEFLDK